MSWTIRGFSHAKQQTFYLGKDRKWTSFKEDVLKITSSREALRIMGFIRHPAGVYPEVVESDFDIDDFDFDDELDLELR